MGRQLRINEVFIQLRQLEYINGVETNVWEWVDSRKTKDTESINRGDIISGKLYNRETRAKYAVYVPGTVQTDEKLIDRHISEIDRHITMRDNIIPCTSAELFNKFRKVAPAGGSMRVLPFNVGIALTYNLLTREEIIIDSFAKEMNLVGIDEQTAIRATNKYEMRKALKKAGVPCLHLYTMGDTETSRKIASAV